MIKALHTSLFTVLSGAVTETAKTEFIFDFLTLSQWRLKFFHFFLWLRSQMGWNVVSYHRPSQILVFTDRFKEGEINRFLNSSEWSECYLKLIDLNRRKCLFYIVCYNKGKIEIAHVDVFF